MGSIAAQRSFIFLWCGSGEGLDKGRECLRKWGFRRCEGKFKLKAWNGILFLFGNKKIEFFMTVLGRC